MARELEEVKWEKFKLGDLFRIKSNLQLNKNSFIFSENGEYPYFTRTVFNNGILGNVHYLDEEHKVKGNCLAVGMIAMRFFYMDKDFYAGQFTKRAIPIGFSLNSRLANYFITVLNKKSKIFQSSLVRNFEKIFKNEEVKLPVKNDGSIDFEFMTSFISELEARQISELEARQISELEAYLVTTGLSDYFLTSEEEKFLEIFRENEVKWKKFKIGDLFEVNSYKKRFDANKVNILEEGHPYVVRTALNNGIRGYLKEDEEFLNEGNTISFGQDTATMFYQEKPYFTGDKIKIIKSKYKEFNKLNSHFFVSTMSKSFSTFAWGSSSFSINIIENQEIYLPIKNNEIDFEFMEILISTIQKIIIKDVVLYSNKKIEATKKLVFK